MSTYRSWYRYVSTVNRTNVGRMYEHYINATSAYLENEFRIMVDKGEQQRAADLLFEYYKIVSPLMYEYAIQMYETPEARVIHLLDMLKTQLRIWLPQNSPNIGAACIWELMQKFPIPTHPVKYVDDAGNTVTTVKPVMLGSLYTLSLEKIGDDWGATSIPKRQHHGIPGKLTDSDKSSLPWRDQAFKMFGESEVRLLLGTLDPQFVSLMVNFPNSPAMCEETARTILRAPQPSNIKRVMDYYTHAKSPGRATQFFNHVMEISGVNVVKGTNNVEK